MVMTSFTGSFGKIIQISIEKSRHMLIQSVSDLIEALDGFR